MSNVIEARGLTKRYGRFTAVDAIDLQIPAGRIVGLIGPNGAGKTSALKAILGLTNYEGELTVLGKDPSHDRAALMEDVCFIADVAVLPRWIRVWQLVEFTENIHPRFSREKISRVPEAHKDHTGPQGQATIQGHGRPTAPGHRDGDRR